MNFFRNTSSNSLGRNNEVVWIRAKRCNCTLQRLAKIRVSDSEANPGRMYYKCKFCNFLNGLEIRSRLGLVKSSTFMKIKLNCKGVFKFYLVRLKT